MRKMTLCSYDNNLDNTDLYSLIYDYSNGSPGRNIDDACDINSLKRVDSIRCQIYMRQCLRQFIRIDNDMEESGMNICDMFDYLRTKQDELNGIELSYWERLSKEMKEIFYNMDIKAVDGGVFWRSIDLKNGWSIQINSVTNNCRILDDKRFRRCYGPRRLVLGALIDKINKKAV